MARHLLDSDILIWILRGKQQAVDFVLDLLKNEVPAISALACYEVWAGARTSEEKVISDFLSSFEVFPVNQEIARQGAQYYRSFRSKGVTLSMADALIAGTARAHGLILVTQNSRDFPMTDIEIRSL
ncbi:MAG TPA: type II toxin-antitoxin system VapC family toxin [Acidobacteriota bacterium]|nr:type II toxin-antitoxin system VapC family toxin [Acidobacteriota bacterium]